MINRRNLLKISGTVIAASVLGSENVLGSQDFEGNLDRLGMLTDTTRCIGCRRCEGACNRANNLPPAKTSFEDTSMLAKTSSKSNPIVRRYTVVNRFEGE